MNFWLVFPPGPPESTAWDRFRAFNARMDAGLGFPNEHTSTYGEYLTHPDESRCAVEVQERCFGLLTEDEFLSLLSYDEMKADGWWPPLRPRAAEGVWEKLVNWWNS